MKSKNTTLPAKVKDITEEKKMTIESVVKEAEGFVIKTDEDYVYATNTLLNAKNIEKEIDEETDKVQKPLKEALKAEKNRWAPLYKMLEKVNDTLRPKMVKFNKDKEQKALKAHDALQAQVMSGRITNPETIEKKATAIAAMLTPNMVHTGKGAAQGRKLKVVKIDDESLIPDEYWVIDMKKLNDAILKQNLVVPGAHQDWEDTIAII